MPIVIGPSFRAVARFGLCCTVLFFFMAGLLLHFECASLGAYRIPLVAGPLIPSRYAVVLRIETFIRARYIAIPASSPRLLNHFRRASRAALPSVNSSCARTPAYSHAAVSQKLSQQYSRHLRVR